MSDVLIALGSLQFFVTAPSFNNAQAQKTRKANNEV